MTFLQPIVSIPPSPYVFLLMQSRSIAILLFWYDIGQYFWLRWQIFKGFFTKYSSDTELNIANQTHQTKPTTPNILNQINILFLPYVELSPSLSSFSLWDSYIFQQAKLMRFLCFVMSDLMRGQKFHPKNWNKIYFFLKLFLCVLATFPFTIYI